MCSARCVAPLFLEKRPLIVEAASADRMRSALVLAGA